MSSNSIKCPQCGFVGWANEQFCRRCGCDFNYAYSYNSYIQEEEEKPSSKNWIIWLVGFAVFVVVATLAFAPNTKKPKEEKVVLNSGSESKPKAALKKPINTPGERVDFKQFMSEGNTNIVYFYADW